MRYIFQIDGDGLAVELISEDVINFNNGEKINIVFHDVAHKKTYRIRATEHDLLLIKSNAYLDKTTIYLEEI
jgi:hypothetical protein